jgi:hypothetical protein
LDLFSSRFQPLYFIFKHLSNVRCVAHCRGVTNTFQHACRVRENREVLLRVIFSMISSVSKIDSASAVKVDAILATLNFQLIPSLMSIAANPTNGSFSIFEPSVGKYLLIPIFSWIFLIPRCDPLLPFPHRKIPWPCRRGFHTCS